MSTIKSTQSFIRVVNSNTRRRFTDEFKPVRFTALFFFEGKKAAKDDSDSNLVNYASDEVQFVLEDDGELIGVNLVNVEAGIASILFRGDLYGAVITAKRTI